MHEGRNVKEKMEDYGENKRRKKVQIVLRETSKMCKGRKDYGEE